jgi:hypothetical protein
MLTEIDRVMEQCLQEAMAERNERRALRRKPFFRRVRIARSGESSVEETVFCRDVSRTGIGLLHDVHLAPGGQFTLAIPLLGRSLEVQCQTQWCVPVTERWYSSGNDYSCALTPQSLCLWPAIVADGLHRRLQRRYPFCRPVTLEDARGTTCEAICRDVSQGGISFLHRGAIPLGRTVVSIPAATGESLVARADIRRCEPIGDGWYTSGGRFPVERVDELLN